MDLSRFVPGFDISVPLGLTSGRNGAPGLDALEALAPKDLLASAQRPAPRAFWLTFRGSVNYGASRERRHLLLPLANRSTAKWPIVMACHCSKDRHGRYLGRDLRKQECDALALALRQAPGYLRSLNTTFALVPAGMQPASFRLDEVMAAGAIPIFVTGDLDDTSPYVLPFEEYIPWSKISLQFAWEHVDYIIDQLANIPDDKVATMQHGVQRAWRRFLRPPLAHRQTFYRLLEDRVRWRAQS
jgi:hypothetical protein